ncbi:MAG TPA: glycosyltransferase [Phycisphaerae bacterium]|jgi:cellulose synthase/poly-beta-1,6-N-acetylglucosamine synthase-like glycosyltransferase|nr:glycosyltransferase [Phycisphaerae bacterium]HOB75837.1 glycosyltransferase [Phycisphaerae bacterium]HOJ54536.1 glycosyltransferase [Phycisphaerae bacterium]HOL27071.1 glycosyltransferase [Phycisphaerae bacterium]HPP22131.1 glycosyltransferase [Phycisphaerae bacterium]
MAVNRVFDYCILILFLVSTGALAVYGIHLYVLLYLFRRRNRGKCLEQREFVEHYLRTVPPEEWLGVTSQIPIYNEAEVAARVIRAVAAMEYPAGKHSIQVLDDSTDETRFLVDRTVRRLRRQGVDIEVIRREKRTGFKAGALREGLAKSRHPLVAVFDADFVPPPDFLKRATPLLARDERLACIQGRWSHLNANESWLTNAQSVGIDGHFAVEQGARAWNNLLMNFNGTAGVWRKAAIEDPAVGGWSADTLTEDLDLSYRAQLAGWRIDYCLDLACPAELPNTVNALKAQQRRWATGSIQTAVKLLPRIWRSRITLAQKLEATLHLTHYSVSFWMVVLALLARPMLLAMDPLPVFSCFLFGWFMVIFSSLAPPLVYGYARYSLGGGWTGLTTVPALMVLGTGMSINNGLAVLRGLFQRGGEFVRTPKSGSTQSASMASRYKARRNRSMWFIEMLLGAYCLANFAIYLTVDHMVFSLFLGIYAVGYLAIGWMSRPEANLPRRVVVLTEPDPDVPAVLTPASSPVLTG